MARLLCPKCSPEGSVSSAVRRVSPDYAPAHHAEFVSRAVLVNWFYDGEHVDQFMLSPEFASAEYVVLGNHPLPADYPSWIHKVKFECLTCFDKRGGPKQC